jgi:hypothetical protein
VDGNRLHTTLTDAWEVCDGLDASVCNSIVEVNVTNSTGGFYFAYALRGPSDAVAAPGAPEYALRWTPLVRDCTRPCSYVSFGCDGFDCKASDPDNGCACDQCLASPTNAPNSCYLIEL